MQHQKSSSDSDSEVEFEAQVHHGAEICSAAHSERTATNSDTSSSNDNTHAKSDAAHDGIVAHATPPANQTRLGNLLKQGVATSLLPAIATAGTIWGAFAVFERQRQSDAVADLRPARQTKFVNFTKASKRAIEAQKETYQKSWDCQNRRAYGLREAVPAKGSAEEKKVQSIVARAAVSCLPGKDSAYAQALNKLDVEANALSQVSEPELLYKAKDFVEALPTLETIQHSLTQATWYAYHRDKELAKDASRTQSVSEEYLANDGRCGQAVDSEFDEPLIDWIFNELPDAEVKERELDIGWPVSSGGMARDICLTATMPYPRPAEPGYVDMKPATDRLEELRAHACQSLYSTGRDCVLRVTVPPRRDGYPHLDRKGP